jgi:hypothetical protein
MLSMLRAGVANPSMSFDDIQKVCDEPDIHEFEDTELDAMQTRWDKAREIFLAESRAR